MQLPERSLEVLHFREPYLEFGFGQATFHPKDGLFLYGPHRRPRTTKDINIGVIGTNEGVGFFRRWAEQIKKRVEVPPPEKGEKQNRLHLANFPGTEEAFCISFNEKEFVTCTVDGRSLDAASRIVNLHQAVDKVVRLYVDRIRQHINNEERNVDLWVLVVPETIFERCKPAAKRSGLPLEKGDFGKRQKTRSDLPLLQEQINHESEDIFDDVPDFHRRVKAECLMLAPTQILRETTLAPTHFKNRAGYPLRRTQDRATIA